MTRAYILIKRFDSNTALLLFGIYTALWGVWLLNPALQTFDTTIAFKHLAGFAPEEYWGSVAVLIGSLKLLTLLTAHVRWRQVVAGIGALFWIFIAVSFAQSNPGSTAVLSAGIAALANILSFFAIR